MLNGEHSIIRRVEIIGVVVGLIGVAVAVFLYLENLKFGQEQLVSVIRSSRGRFQEGTR